MYFHDAGERQPALRGGEALPVRRPHGAFSSSAGILVGHVPAPARHRTPDLYGAVDRVGVVIARAVTTTAKWLFVAARDRLRREGAAFRSTPGCKATPDAEQTSSVVLADVLLKMAYRYPAAGNADVPRKRRSTSRRSVRVRGWIGITSARSSPRDRRQLEADHRVLVGCPPRLRHPRCVHRLTNKGISGGLFTMLSHGLAAGHALRLLVGVLYDDRQHVRA